LQARERASEGASAIGVFQGMGPASPGNREKECRIGVMAMRDEIGADNMRWQSGGGEADLERTG
jgi:hypothetical protein